MLDLSKRSRVGLLLCVSFAAYVSALGNGFVWDDHQTIERGRLIDSVANIPSLFAHDTMFNSDGGRFIAQRPTNTYRPLTMTTFFVEHALFGKRPSGYHATSVFIHVANVLLLFVVGGALGVSPNAALLGALAFAVHPAIGEAVHWINGRSDPLCLLFFLAALLCWLRGKSWSVVVLLVWASTMCKESAFMLAASVPLLIPLVGAQRPDQPAATSPPRRWVALVPWAAGVMLGLACRLGALRQVAVAGGGTQLRYALARLPSLWWHGLVALAIPTAQMPPSLVETYRQVSPGSTAFAAACLAACAIYCVRRRRAGAPLAAWAFGCYLLTMGPVALLTYLNNYSGWGRYLYLSAPMLMLAAAAALVDRGLPRLRPPLARAILFGVALVIAIAGVESFAAGHDWRNDRSFASALIVDHPQQQWGYLELASVELRDGHPLEALALARRAVEIDASSAQAWSYLAFALMRLDRRAEAFSAAERALALDPKDSNALYVGAFGAIERGDQVESARRLIEALAGDPSHESEWNLMRQISVRLGAASSFVSTVRAMVAEPRYSFLGPHARALLP